MRWILVLLVTITLCSATFAQTKARSDSQGGNVEQVVMRIEKEMLDALLKGDASASERYMAATYVFTGPDGLVVDKAQSIADLKSGALKLQSATLDDAKVRVHGDTAIVTVLAVTTKARTKGKTLAGKTRWTDVFVKQNGEWRLVATHGSRISQQ